MVFVGFHLQILKHWQGKHGITICQREYMEKSITYGGNEVYEIEIINGIKIMIGMKAINIKNAIYRTNIRKTG